MRRKVVPLVGLAVGLGMGLLLLVSCPNPLSMEILLHVKDSIGPQISITSPAEASYCAKTVIVAGTVSDSSSQSGDAGKVKLLSYEVLSTDLAGDIELESGGAFAFQFSTASLGDNFVLRITAVDWNGNKTEKSITLLKNSDDDIPSFAAEPGNHSVTLRWDAVPNTSSYSIYYTTEGSFPSEDYGEIVNDATSGFPLGGLRNGSMHVFRLRARSSIPGGEDNWSGYRQVIPLASQTLVPQVIPQVRQSRIVWPGIPAIAQFEVWRSADRDGPYTFISGVRSGNEYTDLRSYPGGGYYYKIRPAHPGATFSGPQFGAPAPFPAQHALPLGGLQAQEANDVATSAGFAYIAGGSSGFRILNLANPESPVAVKTIPMNNPISISVFGNTAYVGDFPTGLNLVEIANPASAAVVKAISTTSYVSRVAVSGDYAYAAQFYNSLLIIDISDLATAHVEKTIDLPFITGVAASGNRAYVSDLFAGLRIVDVSVPASAAVIKTVATTCHPSDVAVSGGYAYLAGDSGLDIIDISNEPSASVVTTVTTPDYARRIVLLGSQALLAQSSAGVQIIDLSSLPAATTAMASFPTSGSAIGLSLADSYIYTAEGSNGLQVIDCRPALAKPAGSQAIDSAADSVLAGQYLYVASNSTGLQILDVAAPAAPALVRTVPISNACSVAVAGNFAYVLSFSGLNIVDISDPAQAQCIRTVSSILGGSDIAVFGDIACIANCGDGGVHLFDISDPTQVSSVGALHPEGSPERIAFLGHTAFIACDIGGLSAYDFSSPRSPRLLGAPVAVNGAIGGFALSEDHAFISYAGDGSSGFLVVDISDPANLRTVLNDEAMAPATDLAIAAQYLYFVDGSVLRVFDVTDPASPGPVTTLSLEGASRVSVSGQFAYCPGDSTVQVVDLGPAY